MSTIVQFRKICFIGNNRNTLLEQLEEKGFKIPYFCRAGICGACKLNILVGKVKLINSIDTNKSSWILSCSTILIPNIFVYIE